MPFQIVFFVLSKFDCGKNLPQKVLSCHIFLFSARFTQTADKITRKLVEEEIPSDDEHKRQAKIPPRQFLEPFVRSCFFDSNKTLGSRLAGFSTSTEVSSPRSLRPLSPTGSYSFNFKPCDHFSTCKSFTDTFYD